MDNSVLNNPENRKQTSKRSDESVTKQGTEKKDPGRQMQLKGAKWATKRRLVRNIGSERK